MIALGSQVFSEGKQRVWGRGEMVVGLGGVGVEEAGGGTWRTGCCSIVGDKINETKINEKKILATMV